MVLFAVSLPFIAAAILVIRITLGRPVFFSQFRSGQGGRPFRIVKLRTMRPQPAAGPDLSDAARVTPATALLRRLRIDELPQLVAVLRGELALVGPRPLLPETVAGFGPAGEKRGTVRPGLTGWAQVSGNTRLDDEEKLRLDLWYVDNRSAALDLRILRETVSVALFGERRRPERIAAALDPAATPSAGAPS